MTDSLLESPRSREHKPGVYYGFNDQQFYVKCPRCDRTVQIHWAKPTRNYPGTTYWYNSHDNISSVDLYGVPCRRTNHPVTVEHTDKVHQYLYQRLVESS